MHKKLLKNIVIRIKRYTFGVTVLATLPIRTASQGESFAFKSILFSKQYTSLASLRCTLGGSFLLSLKRNGI